MVASGPTDRDRKVSIATDIITKHNILGYNLMGGFVIAQQPEPFYNKHTSSGQSPLNE